MNTTKNQGNGSPTVNPEIIKRTTLSSFTSPFAGANGIELQEIVVAGDRSAQVKWLVRVYEDETIFETEHVARLFFDGAMAGQRFSESW